MSNKCGWIHYDEDGDDVWRSECGHDWAFFDSMGPKDNGMNFCPFCGNPLKDCGSRKRHRLFAFLGEAQ